MLKVEEARRIILENTKPLECENVDLLSALGRVLAEDIYSTIDIPSFNNSAMDGYAVVAASLKGASKDNPVSFCNIEKLAAGHTTKTVVKGFDVIKVMTGAPVPEGADAVVPIEYAIEEKDTVRLLKEPGKWENIRFAGEDVKKGQLAIKSGTKIRPAEIGMLAAINKMKVNVVRKPTVSILATGDELADSEEDLTEGKIRNVNSYSLFAEALKYGCTPINLGTAKDTEGEVMEKLRRGMDSNILIVSGGVSVGDYDYVKAVLKELGMKEIFWKVAIKPGKPVLFGVMNDTLVFGLPGNPVSALVTFRQFVLPAVYKMLGCRKQPWSELNATLEECIQKDKGLAHFLRGTLIVKDGRLFVRKTGPQSSGLFSSMVNSDCLIVVPEEVIEINSGEETTVQIYYEMGE